MRFGFFLVLSLSAAAAWSQTYPSKPVRVVVPYPAGSTPDIIGRALAERLQAAFGQPFIVENRSGAGGNIGAEAVAKAGDPHVLLVGGNGPVAINKHLYTGLAFDPDRDLVPISLLASAPQMLVVKNDARLFLVHIPYRGFPPAVTDMLSGNIDAMFAIIPAVLPHTRAGKMKGLAVTGLKRTGLAPDIPSVAELGLPQLESLAWNGLLAPAGTPPAVVSRLSAEAVNAMRHPQTREALGRLGFDVVASSPEEFSRWIRAESEKWARVIRASGATAD
jgi:tripartite-type tricarboxylate transporter receptor subunit TctC